MFIVCRSNFTCSDSCPNVRMWHWWAMWWRFDACILQFVLSQHPVFNLHTIRCLLCYQSSTPHGFCITILQLIENLTDCLENCNPKCDLFRQSLPTNNTGIQSHKNVQSINTWKKKNKFYNLKQVGQSQKTSKFRVQQTSNSTGNKLVESRKPDTMYM